MTELNIQIEELISNNATDFQISKVFKTYYKEYLDSIEVFKSLRMNKEEWYNLEEYERILILEELRKFSEFKKTYIRKKINRELDPYGEEDWDN
jgi:hypothetical protein